MCGKELKHLLNVYTNLWSYYFYLCNIVSLFFISYLHLIPSSPRIYIYISYLSSYSLPFSVSPRLSLPLISVPSSLPIIFVSSDIFLHSFPRPKRSSLSNMHLQILSKWIAKDSIWYQHSLSFISNLVFPALKMDTRRSSFHPPSFPFSALSAPLFFPLFALGHYFAPSPSQSLDLCSICHSVKRYLQNIMCLEFPTL